MTTMARSPTMTGMKYQFIYRCISIWIGTIIVLVSTPSTEAKTKVHSQRTMHHDTKYMRTGIREDPQFRIPYENHPFERHLTQDTDTTSLFQPIRIQFDTENLEKELNVFKFNNDKKIDFIKSVILPGAADFWSQALSVIPVKNNLILQKGELYLDTYCFDELAIVPKEHMTDGIPETDLVLYVSGSKELDACPEGTLASALFCNFDQFDRPTAGAINFCLDTINMDSSGNVSDEVVERTLETAIHEVGHVLGMVDQSFKFFYNPDTGQPRTQRPFQETTIMCPNGVPQPWLEVNENTLKFIEFNGVSHATIVTPRVQQVVRNQFNCPTLEGAALENLSTSHSCIGSHWDERFFFSESMSAVEDGVSQFLSPLTLALLEDSGWYMANYTQISVSPFGHAAGCNFLTEPCIEVDYYNDDYYWKIIPLEKDYFRGFFCTEPDANVFGCSPALTHKAVCAYGFYQNEMCPLNYGSYYDDIPNLDCTISDNALDASDNPYLEVHGDNSMCFETVLDGPLCYKATCMVDDFYLKVEVNGQTLICEEDFQMVSVTVSNRNSIDVTCPRLSSACPDMFCPHNCSGRGVCNFSATVNGIQRPKCECNDINDMSLGCTESAQIRPLLILPEDIATTKSPTNSPTKSPTNSNSPKNPIDFFRTIFNQTSSAFDSPIGIDSIRKVMFFNVLVILCNVIL